MNSYLPTTYHYNTFKYKLHNYISMFYVRCTKHKPGCKQGTIKFWLEERCQWNSPIDDNKDKHTRSHFVNVKRGVQETGFAKGKPLIVRLCVIAKELHKSVKEFSINETQIWKMQ